MTPHPLKTSAVLATALLVGCVLAGCSHNASDAEESAGQSTDVVMSGGYVVNEDGTLRQPDVGARVPELDGAAYQFNEIGARYAAQHFLALTEYAWATGNTQPMRDFSTTNCTLCQDMISRINDLYDSGGWASGISYNVITVLRAEELTDFEDLGDAYGVTLKVNTSPNTTYRNGLLEESDGEIAELTLFASWLGDDWVIVDGSAEVINDASQQ